MFKRIWRVGLAGGLVLALTGCNLLSTGIGGGGQTVTSGPPVVRLASPLPNATFLEGVAVNIQAQVTNAGTGIDRVEVVVDGTIVATVPNPNPTNAAAFSISQSWKAAGVGSHAVSVTAFRSTGTNSTPASVNISVVNQVAAPSATPTLANAVDNPPNSTGNDPNQTVKPTADTSAQVQPTNTLQPTNTQAPAEPTLTPTPSRPTVTTTQGINVRRGPNLVFNPPVGSMPANVTANILAVSPDKAWYKVTSQYGEGWVSGAFVTVSGDLATIPVDAGPPTPIPVTPTPTPVPATATPVTSINLVAGAIRLSPAAPKCKETYQVNVDVANTGSQASPSGALSIQDVYAANGTVLQTVPAGFGAIEAGKTVGSGNVPITSSTYFAEAHKIVVIVDPNNAIAETNESDNRAEITFTLEKGGC